LDAFDFTVFLLIMVPDRTRKNLLFLGSETGGERAATRNRPVILPISGRKLKSITAGARSMGVVSGGR
jgi:hypothetical protein